MTQNIDIYARIQIFNQIGDLSYFRGMLVDSNPARYKYMSIAQRNEERTRLINTMLLIRMEAEEHMQRARKAKLKNCCDELQSCCDKLAQLDNIDKSLELELGREKPLSYLGLYAHLDTIHESTDPEDPVQVKKMVQEAREFARIIKALEDPLKDRIGVLRQFIGVFNDNRRTHWTAGVSSMTAFLEYLRGEYSFPYQSNLETGINSFSWSMGCLSAFIYFFRLFGVELHEAIIEARSDWHPVDSPLVSIKNKEALRRFFDDVTGMRKYILLNDILWGAVNLLTFVYLTGSMTTTLGFAGSCLTLAFLVVDVMLVSARFFELKRDYDKKKQILENKAQELQNELDIINAELRKLQIEAADDDRKKLENKRIYLENTIKEIKAARIKLEFDWKYQKYALWTELAATASLIGAYGLMCGCFVIGITGALTMGLVGAGLWFVLSIAYAGANIAIESAKITASIEQRKNIAEQLLIDFKKPDLTDDEKRNLYLNIKELLARNNYEKEYINFLRKKTVVRTLMHLAVPIVIFSSMVFLPIIWAIPAIMVFVAIVCFINWRINIWLENIQPLKNDSKFFPSVDTQDKISEKYEAQYREFIRSTEGLTLETFEEAPIKLPIKIASNKPNRDYEGAGTFSDDLGQAPTS